MPFVTTGIANSAFGAFSQFSLTTGNFNTAVGVASLDVNNGNSNTAVGVAALLLNTADANTGVGVNALGLNTAGESNAAVGAFALYNNMTGGSNTAVGFNALLSNTIGNDNTAVGHHTLGSHIAGDNNTAIGFGALNNTTSGSDNTALGVDAGNNVTTADHVICIGPFVFGANVSDTTWIGNVYGVTTQSGTTAPVVVSDTGQLGTVASSERFKKDIATMEKASEAILSLRPVTFHYKTDTKDTPQFGLIAEEVARINPALVLPDKGGKPYTVRYDAVNAMLLNEFLQEHKTVEELKSIVAEQRKGMKQMATQLKEQAAQIQKVSAQLEMSKPSPQTVLNNQ
jgi:uncharacterized coiled-coil protein SlyX